MRREVEVRVLSGPPRNLSPATSAGYRARPGRHVRRVVDHTSGLGPRVRRCCASTLTQMDPACGGTDHLGLGESFVARTDEAGATAVGRSPVDDDRMIATLPGNGLLTIAVVRGPVTP